jgi:hypothetical protein
MNKQILMEQLKSCKVADAQSAPGMAVFPIIYVGQAALDYISLHEALRHNSFEVTEVSQGGSVPNLRVHNRGLKPVLLLDGEELRGAKQNRILNISILVPPESVLTVPVSCVEHGRWSYRGNHFEESGNMMPRSANVSKKISVSNAMLQTGERCSDQGKVWDDVADMHRTHETNSPTGAMNDMYTAKAPDLEEFCAAFPLLPGQCGFFVQFGNGFAGIDLVSRPDVWKDLHAKIVRSYAVELLGRRLQPVIPIEDLLDQTLDLLADEGMRSYPAIGLGSDLRIDLPGLVGSALLWEKEIVHLGLYPVPQTQQEEKYDNPRNRYRHLAD